MHEQSGGKTRDRGVASGTFVSLVFAGLLCGILVVGKGDAAASGDGGDAGRRRGESAIQVGQEAPDFELLRLECVKTAGGARTGAEEKIKLSSYRAKKPVFIVFASYT